MKRLLPALIALVFCAGNSVQAQNQLTLEDAVMQQWRKFYPSDLNQFHWLDQNKYAIVEDNTLLIINEEDTNKISTEMLTSETLNRFPRVTWESNSQFSYRLPSDQKVYRYNIETKTKSDYSMDGGSNENLNASPNARFIAYTNLQSLYLFDTKTNTHKSIAESTKEGISYGQVVHRYEFGVEQGSFWSPKSKYLAYYRNDERTVAQYPIVHTNQRIAEPELIRYPMAGEKSEEVTLEIYVVETGQTIQVHTTGDKEQYLTNIAFSPDEETLYIAILNRDQNKVELNAYESRSGRFLKTLFVESDEKFVQPLHAMQFIPKRHSEFLWRSKRDGFDHFYRYDTNGKLLNQVSEGDFDVKSTLGFVGSKLYYTAYQNHGMEEHLMSSSIFKTKSTKLTSEPGVHHIQLSELGRIYDSYSNLETPRKVQLLDYKGKKIKDLYTAKNPYEQVVIAQTELGELVLDDKTVLNSRLIKPHNFDLKKRYPVLVYVYNGPGVQLIQNKWLAGASLWMHYLANQGYLVYTLDGRGSAHRGKVFEQATFRNLGFVEMEDQIKGVDYLKSLDFVDKDRIAVHGWSYGGFMTTGLLLNYPDVFTCGVAGGPVMDWSLYEVMYTERSMDTPQSNPEGFANNNWIEQVSKLQDPLLLIHGTADDVVLWQHSLEFVRKCVEEGVEVDYFAYPEHKHNVRGKDRVHLIKKMIKYIQQNNQ